MTETYTFAGKTLTLREWAKLTGINFHTLRERIRMYGWPVERALTTPPRSHTPRDEERRTKRSATIVRHPKGYPIPEPSTQPPQTAHPPKGGVSPDFHPSRGDRRGETNSRSAISNQRDGLINDNRFQ